MSLCSIGWPIPQTGLQFIILLPQPLECCHNGHAPPHSAKVFFLRGLVAKDDFVSLRGSILLHWEHSGNSLGILQVIECICSSYAF